MTATAARHVAVTLAWVGAVAVSALNGVAVGYGAIWLQFFGDSPDAADYRMSAGGYGAAAVVLALAVPAMLARGGPRWLVLPTVVTACVLGVLAGGSALRATEAEEPSRAYDGAWDGIAGVLWGPWTWVLLALGVQGLYQLTMTRGPVAEEPSR